MLFVLRSELIHRKLVLTRLQHKVLTKRVDVQVAVDLTDTAVALVDLDGRERRERDRELDSTTMAGTVVTRQVMFARIEI